MPQAHHDERGGLADAGFYAVDLEATIGQGARRDARLLEIDSGVLDLGRAHPGVALHRPSVHDRVCHCFESPAYLVANRTRRDGIPHKTPIAGCTVPVQERNAWQPVAQAAWRGSMVRGGRLAVFSQPVTHDEIRAQVAPYAAGGVTGAVADDVRAHLASGCPDCLRMLYAQRARLSREATSPNPPRAGRAPLLGIIVGVVLGGLAAGAAIHLALRTGMNLAPLIPASRASDLDRVRSKMAVETADVNAKLARAEAELQRLQQDLARLRSDQANEAQRRVDQEPAKDVPPADDVESLRDALAVSEQHARSLAREVRVREAEVERLQTAQEGAAALKALLATPGVRVVALRPQAGLHDPRGHAVIAPGAASVVVYAEGLPQRGGLLVRLLGTYGELLRIEEIHPEQGAVFSHVRLTRPAYVERVEIVRDSGDPVLAGPPGT